jgi:hypothetical protein
MNKFIAHYNDVWESEYIEIWTSFDDKAVDDTMDSMFN